MEKVAILFILIIPSLLFSAFAQSSTQIMAKTDKSTYQPGDKVTINGTVENTVNENPVTIIVRNPIGNVYVVGQEKLFNNAFIHDFVLNDNSQDGTYTIDIKQGVKEVELHFVVNTGQVLTIQVLDSVIKVRSNGTNPIKYGEASVSMKDFTIKIPMDTSSVSGNSVDQQYQIPKRIVDSLGNQVIVKTDNIPIECTQSETSTTRILDCHVPSNSKELELIGTVVIPEFGILSIMVISISTLMIIIISRRSRFTNL